MERRTAVKACAAAAVVVALAAAQCRADEVVATKRWEIGVDMGMLYPMKAHQFSNSLDNGIVYNLLVRETIGDEVAEGFNAPPFPGWSTVSSSIKPLYELAGHVHYRWQDGVWVGLEGGWAFQRGTFIDSQGIYDRHFLKLRDESGIVHAAPVVKLAPRFGRLRPSLTFGPEWTMVRQQTFVSFTDPDDKVDPTIVIDKHNSYAGVLGGAGLEWTLSETGAIQASVAYHKVFAPGGKFDYVTPQLRLIVRF